MFQQHYVNPKRNRLFYEGQFQYFVKKRFEELRLTQFRNNRPINQCELQEQAERFVQILFEGLDETNYFNWVNYQDGDILERYYELKKVVDSEAC